VDGELRLIDLGLESLAGAVSLTTLGAQAVPTEVTFLPDRALAYVGIVRAGGLGRFAVVDTESREVTRVIDVNDNGSRLRGQAASPDGRLVYAADWAAGEIVVLSTESNTVAARIDVRGSPEDVAVSTDGQLIYATGNSQVFVIDVTHAVVGQIPLVGVQVSDDLTPDGGVAFSPDGAFAYVAGGDVAVIETATGTQVATVDTQGVQALDLEVTPDGTFVYVAGVGGLVVIDAATNSVVTTIGAGAEYWSVAMAPDGTFVYVAAPLDDEIVIIDRATNSVTARIAVETPVEVAVEP
jgi:YVTN family beta-propeller protein